MAEYYCDYSPAELSFVKKVRANELDAVRALLAKNSSRASLHLEVSADCGYGLSEVEGRRALIDEVCESPNVEMARLLLQHGARINVAAGLGANRDSTLQSLFSLQSKCPRLPMLEMLVEMVPAKELDLVGASSRLALPGLVVTCEGKDDVSLLNFLHKAGCDLNARDHFGRTAYHRAIYNSHRSKELSLAAVQALRAAGAKIGLSDASELGMAVARSLPEVTELLLEAGADTHYEENMGQDHSCVGMRLYKLGKCTALHVAAAKNSLKCAALLLRYGADPFALTQLTKQSCVDCAATDEMRQLLLQNSAGATKRAK
jgi:ankyrin repeat protein